MTCQQAIDEFLTDYLEGRLSLGERLRFNLHLAICSHCRRYLDTYRRTLALGRGVGRQPDASPPSEMPEELVKAILAARDDGGPKPNS